MSYSSEVLADSPLAYYRMGEASGTALADASGNGRNATVTAGTTMGVTGALVGDANTAMSFNGSQYGDIPHDAGLDVSSVTLEAWVKTTDSDGIVVGTNHSSGYPHILRVHSSLGLYFEIRTAASSGWYAASNNPAALLDGAWHHVVGTYEPGYVRAYLDGVLVAENTGGTPPAAGIYTVAVDRTIARRGSGTYLVGSVDEVAIYGSALGAGRIAAHYTAATTAGSSGSLAATLPSLSSDLSGAVTFSGSIAAALPGLGANLAGETYPPGIAGDFLAALPPLSGSLVGAYSDTATLAAILPPLSANLTGTYAPPPITGTIAATLPSLAASLVGTAYEPGMTGTLDALLPGLSASLSGQVLGRNGLGLALDSTATLTVLAEIDTTTLPTPTGTPGVPATVLHIIAPTVPVPTLVDGRPQ